MQFEKLEQEWIQSSYINYTIAILRLELQRQKIRDYGSVPKWLGISLVERPVANSEPQEKHLSAVTKTIGSL